MATALAVVPSDPKHYVWWFPGSPVKVHLDLQMAQRLNERLQGIGAGVPDQGLLFGRMSEGAVELLDFQPVNGNVASTIAALPNEQGKRLLMGYYRTEQEEIFQLNARDASLADECFQKPCHVFLMIQSKGFGSPNATFFFRDGDRKMADFAFLEFPWDPSLLANEERDRIRRSHQAAVARPLEAPAPAPVPSTSASPRNQSRVLFKVIKWTVSIALVFALGAWANTFFRTRFDDLRRAVFSPPVVNSATALVSPSSPLPLIALHARRQSGDLELTWNRESTLIATATSGVVTIQDGESAPKRQIALDSTQVRAGSLLYSPTSDQIVMQLAVTTPTDTITESVMVVLPKAGSPHTYPLPQTEPKTPPDSVVLAKASKPFQENLAAKGAPSPAPPILTDTPALKLDLHGANAVAPGFVSQTAAPLPPARPTPSQPPAATPSQPPAPVVVKYQPAVAINKVAPKFPPELQVLAVSRKVIEVTVTIDKTGRVIKAEAIPQKNVSQFLINSAVNAARTWRFQPALRDNEPVSSEMVLQFLFGQPQPR